MRNKVFTFLFWYTTLVTLKYINTIYPKTCELMGNLVFSQITTYHKNLHNRISQIIIPWSLNHLVWRNENWHPYSNLHYITMDKQPRLVIHYKNFITIENHITSSPRCFHGCHHNLLMHEFYHFSTKVFNLMLFVKFLGLPRIQTKGFILSYSNMGQCYCNKCKIVANYIIIFVFFPTILVTTWATTLSQLCEECNFKFSTYLQFLK